MLCIEITAARPFLCPVVVVARREIDRDGFRHPCQKRVEGRNLPIVVKHVVGHVSGTDHEIRRKLFNPVDGTGEPVDGCLFIAGIETDLRV